MKKTSELIKENLKAVDAVVEVLDARIPFSSRNNSIGRLVGDSRQRIIILNKRDLADEAATAEWAERMSSEGIVMDLNSSSGEGTAALSKLFTRLRDEKNEGRERKRPYRLMVVGIPNVGKSSLINRLTGSRSARTGNRPGVTRGKQWLNLGGDIMLLDTPGILQPKLENDEVGKNLAFCGSIKDEIMDLPSLGMELVERLSYICPDLLCARYRLDSVLGTPLETMEAIARKRGFILPGKRIDHERTARTVLDEFRAGIIGRITLESADTGIER